MVHRLNLSDPLYSVLLHEFLLGMGSNGCENVESRRSEKCTVNDTQNTVPRKRIILINKSSDTYLFELVFYGSLH